MKRQISSSSRVSGMRAYSVGRGRKKAVKEFTIRHGLVITGIILAAILAILLLWHIGLFHLD